MHISPAFLCRLPVEVASDEAELLSQARAACNIGTIEGGGSAARREIVVRHKSGGVLVNFVL